MSSTVSSARRRLLNESVAFRAHPSAWTLARCRRAMAQLRRALAAQEGSKVGHRAK